MFLEHWLDIQHARSSKGREKKDWKKEGRNVKCTDLSVRETPGAGTRQSSSVEPLASTPAHLASIPSRICKM